MKAIVIGQKLASSMIEHAHGGGRYVKRLVFADPELCVNIADGAIYAFFGFRISEEEFDLYGQVEVSQELFEEFLKIARLNDQIKQEKEEILKNEELMALFEKQGFI